MAKKAIKGYVKLLIRWGQATPAPPVWPALWQKGVAIGEFTKKFNEATKDRMGKLLPVIVTVYEDRSFDFIVKEPPVSELIKEELHIQSWAKNSRDKIGHLTLSQLKKIALIKQKDTNSFHLLGVVKMVAGTAKQMGVTTDIQGMSDEEILSKLESV